MATWRGVESMLIKIFGLFLELLFKKYKNIFVITGFQLLKTSAKKGDKDKEERLSIFQCHSRLIVHNYLNG